MPNWVKATGLALGAVAALLIVGVAWRVLVAGPSIDVSMDERGTLVDTSRLGEYFTASSVIGIAADDGRSVLRLASPTHQCTSLLWRFVAGPNEVPTQLGERCTVEVPIGASTFHLDAARKYRFTIVGDNGFGYIRRSSRVFYVAAAGSVSFNTRATR
jgi:hypothetical protein